jgi:PAS domain S-box-containing protein
MTRHEKAPRVRSRPSASSIPARKSAAPRRTKGTAAPGDADLPDEAEQILNAIRDNEVDALVVRNGASENVFALKSVSELNQSDQIRLQLERRFDTLAAHAPVGIFINDFSGNCLYVNQRGCEIAGLTPAQALGQGLINAVHPEDRERLRLEGELATAAGIPFESEYRYCHPGGKVVWVARKSTPLVGESGKSVARIGTIIDITERKLAEEALRESREQLSSLLEERERLTQDLHDGCIQSIYAIGMNLQSCRQKLDSSPEAARVVASAAANLNLVIQELRSFIRGHGAELHAKPDLEHEIERAGQAARDLGLAFDLDIDRSVADTLAPDVAQHVLQIAREAISNATRHANAQTLRVRLGELDGFTCLEIHDDGNGFDTKSSGHRGLGLHHIEARARALRGRSTITSSPGNGTRIAVRVPLAR